jgi:hypothetical protein
MAKDLGERRLDRVGERKQGAPRSMPAKKMTNVAAR